MVASGRTQKVEMIIRYPFKLIRIVTLITHYVSKHLRDSPGPLLSLAAAELR